MNFLKKIKALFFGNEKEQEEVIENKQLTEYDCWYCEQPIEAGDKKSFNGKKFHKKCYRKMMKQAKRELGVK